MKKLVWIFLVLSMMGCAVPAKEQPAPSACPSLPHLPPGATRQEGRVHWLTVIALYEQCAASRR